MIIEIIITLIIIGVAGLILFRNVKNKSKGNCNCGSCSTSCPYYAKEHSNFRQK